LIPYLAVDLINNMIGTRGIMIAFALVVVGHFQAHYTTLKKETPHFFAWFFVISIVVNTTVGTICLIGSYYTPNSSYQMIKTAFELLWLISMLIVDLTGYYLVRKLFYDLQHCQLSPPSPTTHDGQMVEMDAESQVPLATHSPKDLKPFHSSFDYNQFLQRIKKFHFFFTVLSLFFILMQFIGLTSSSTRPSPDTFSMSGAIYEPYIYLVMWLWLTWWAWIPLKVEDDISSKTNLSSNHRKATVDEHGNHHLTPARNEVDPVSVSGRSDLVQNVETQSPSIRSVPSEFFPGTPSQSDPTLTFKEEEIASSSGQVLLAGIAEDGSIVSRQDN